MASAVGRLLNWIYLGERAIASAAFGVMGILLLIDVTGREVFDHGFHWSQKIAIYLMIWGAFLGSSMTSAKAAHLRPEAATRLWPRRFKGVFEGAAELFTTLFCVFFAYISVLYVTETLEFGDKGTVTELPMWIIQVVIPYTFISMAFRHLMYVFFPSIRPVPKKEHDAAQLEEDLR